MSNEIVLVIGGSGFIASHCILQLLNAGYRVRTTLRSLTREGDVRAMLKQGGVEAGDRLSFVAADLSADAGWSNAVAGCAYVLHGASQLHPVVKRGRKIGFNLPSMEYCAFCAPLAMRVFVALCSRLPLERLGWATSRRRSRSTKQIGPN